jgi:hypothetical protein
MYPGGAGLCPNSYGPKTRFISPVIYLALGGFSGKGQVTTLAVAESVGGGLWWMPP